MNLGYELPGDGDHPPVQLLRAGGIVRVVGSNRFDQLGVALGAVELRGPEEGGVLHPPGDGEPLEVEVGCVILGDVFEEPVVSVPRVFVPEHVEHEAVGCDDGVSVPEVVVGHGAALQWIGLESYEAIGGGKTTFQFDCSKGDCNEMVKYRICYEDGS